MICKCVLKSTHDFSDIKDMVLVFILCLLYAFKYSENKILNPNIPKSFPFYNFRLGIIQRKPDILQTSGTFHL